MRARPTRPVKLRAITIIFASHSTTAKNDTHRHTLFQLDKDSFIAHNTKIETLALILSSLPCSYIAPSSIMNSFAPNNNANSGCVQSTSVTAQFNALGVDRENFRHAKQVALANYSKIQQGLQKSKAEQVALLTQIRTEQEALGNLTRKRDMFSNEKTRLTRAMEHERKALELCVKHFRTLNKDADKATLQFVNDMEEATNEAASIMMREINLGHVALLDFELVESVIVPRLPDDPKLQQDFYRVFENMRKNKEALDNELSRLRTLRSKCDDDENEPRASQQQQPNGTTQDATAELYDGRQQMDLFYGISEQDVDVEMAQD